MALTLDELIARFNDFDPTMAGWHQALAEVPDDLLEEVERHVYAPIPASERTARLTWTQIRKPKPWMMAWVRTLAPDGTKLDVRRCAQLGESPLLEVIERLELRHTKKVDVEALSALFEGAAFGRAPLRHFAFHPNEKYTSKEVGHALAKRLGPTIESLDLGDAVLEGVIESRVDFPKLRHLSVFTRSSGDPGLVSGLVAWPPFARLTSLTTGHDARLVEAVEAQGVRPPLERLEVQGQLALTLLPDLSDLQRLTCRNGAGVLDALAEHPSIRLRALELGEMQSDELADYVRSSKADDLESITLAYGTLLRRACCEAMAASKARPRVVRLHRVVPGAAKVLVESDVLAHTEHLEVDELGSDVVDALIEHPPPKLVVLSGGTNEKDYGRLQAAFGERARVHVRSAMPEAFERTLKFALSQLAQVSGTVSAEGVESLQELWWDADNLAHDAFHNEVSGVRWQPLKALDGLEGAAELQTLVAPRSDIDALEPVADLPLRTINVAHNRRLRSLAPLASCSTLCELDVSHTAVRDLEPLRSVASLRKLSAVGLSLDDAQLQLLAALRKRGVEIKVDAGVSAKVDALAYPSTDGAGTDGARILREAELPGLADAWERHGPDSRDDEGLPVAQRAFEALRRDAQRRREVILGLIEAGADVDAESHGKASTLLSRSVDDPELFGRLLDLGADPQLPRACPPIEAMLQYGRKPNPDVVDRLIAAGAAMTPAAFEDAAALGHLGLVQHALSQGLHAHPNVARKAAWSGSTAVVRALLDAGADPSLALPHARSLEVYDQLIAAGATATARSVRGSSILEELAVFRPDDAGCEAVIGAALHDGVAVTPAVLAKALERCRYGGLAFFRALVDAGASLDVAWFAWNPKKNVHQPRTLRDQRQYPDLVAFAKAQKIPTGAAWLKAKLKHLATPSGPVAPGDEIWNDALALAELLPKPPSPEPLGVLPAWVEAEADRARAQLPQPLAAAVSKLPATHPAVLFALAQGVEGTTPTGRGVLTLACEVWPGQPREAFGAAIEGLLEAGAPVGVGHPRPLECYLQAASSSHTQVRASVVERLMDPGSRTREALFWMGTAVRNQVDDRARVLAAFDDDGNFPLPDVAASIYAELGDLERTVRVAEGLHWVHLTHALHQALQADHLRIVDALLERGASPNFHVSGTQPALFWARSGDAIERLAAAGARIHEGGSQTPAGSIVRSLSHDEGLLDVLGALLEAGAQLHDVEPMTGQTLEAQLRALGREDVQRWLANGA